MNVRLAPALTEGNGSAVADLEGTLRTTEPGGYLLRYRTRTGALLRLGGSVVGAFDREHDTVRLELQPGEYGLALEVERRSLPTSGLPAGPGLRWNLMLAMANEKPSASLGVDHTAGSDPSHAPPQHGGDLPIIGHAHLDVAWLWTYDETRRKAARTFAIAGNLLEANPEYVFTQSQPQLYRFVAEGEPELFDRVRALVRTGRFDPSGAALWVEPDCNLPSGESLLRQLVHGIRYVRDVLGAEAKVAWLPDSFGFANTLPTLLRHAGIEYFATTKLRWNDTTEFPHKRFRWEGPDGSAVLAALFAAYEGGVTRDRRALALERNEPLVVGFSDGGGGPTEAIVEDGTREGRWTTLGAWFEQARDEASPLPVVRDELYLEYHRGVYTTHRDVKVGNAALERALGRAELALSWMVVLHASPFFVEEARGMLARAWEIALRNQFHDVLPGTSITAVYEDVRAEYDEAFRLVGRVMEAARTSLPRFARTEPGPKPIAPRREGDGFVLENAAVRARVRDDGTIVELATIGGINSVEAANVLVAYEDRPSKWEAWNIDRDYVRRKRPVEAVGSEATDEGVFVRYRIGGSYAASRISLAEDEPFLRMELAVQWRERRTLLRCENRVDMDAPRAYFGSPHGVIERAVDPTTAAERAKFEAPGQRFGRLEGATSSEAERPDVAVPEQPAGLTLLALDTYGWSVDRENERTIRLGHSLLRGTTWPDAEADIGEHQFSYAFLPSGGLRHGEVEAAWRRFAAEDVVPELFASDDSAIAVVATKPADDGNGIIVRARECDGVARTAVLAIGGRASEVWCEDALERPVAGEARIENGALTTAFEAFALRSFRVRFG